LVHKQPCRSTNEHSGNKKVEYQIYMINVSRRHNKWFIINQNFTDFKFISCYMFRFSWDHHQAVIYEYVYGYWIPNMDPYLVQSVIFVIYIVPRVTI
jgi:hypothetical protein